MGLVAQTDMSYLPINAQNWNCDNGGQGFVAECLGNFDSIFLSLEAAFYFPFFIKDNFFFWASNI